MKTVWEQSHVGSNPTLSATKKEAFAYRTKASFFETVKCDLCVAFWHDQYVKIFCFEVK